MGGVVVYLLYAGVIIAVILAVEGAWVMARGLAGGGRDLNRRLALARRTGDPGAALKMIEQNTGGALARLIDARLPALKRALWAARAPFSSVQLVGGAVLLCLAAIVGLKIMGAPMLLAVAIGATLGLVVPMLLVSTLASRRRKRFTDQMPQAVDLMARSLQAGHPVVAALGTAAKEMTDPLGTEFGLVIDEMTYGLDRDEALANLVDRFPTPELRMFVASMQVTRETGGNLAEVFMKLAEVIREKAQLRRKVHAISAEGRMSFWVITALPIVLVSVLMVIRPNYYTDVVKDPLFWPMMCSPPVLLLIGAVIIWRMVHFKI